METEEHMTGAGETELSMEQLQELLRTAVLKAGAFMKSSDEREHTDKSNAKDFVTVSDIKAENILRQEVLARVPDATFLSEEDPQELHEQLFDPHFEGFVADPIDGTFNFKRDMRESAISLGFIRNGEIVAGAIYDPYKDELYEAAKGQGAFRNGEPISVGSQEGLVGASIATSNSYDSTAMARNLERHMEIFRQTGELPWTSCPGSGVLIMAWVACGRIDAYHHNGLKPWDNAAAFLLVREAGGIVQTLNGEEAPFTSATVLMGNPSIVNSLRDIFEASDPEKKLLS